MRLRDQAKRDFEAVFELSDIEKFFETLAADFLSSYISKIESGSIILKSKEFNDPIWGTISFSALEMAVIDSPLFQRLRLVRQLGVAHWVYPGATHTRFEHSLGVLFQAQQLANALNAFPKWDKPSSDTSSTVSNTDVQLLRLSALVHDIGHPCFSHVAEKAIMNFTEYQLTCVSFQEKSGADNPSLQK